MHIMFECHKNTWLLAFKDFKLIQTLNCNIKALLLSFKLKLFPIPINTF